MNRSLWLVIKITVIRIAMMLAIALSALAVTGAIHYQLPIHSKVKIGLIGLWVLFALALTTGFFWLPPKTLKLMGSIYLLIIAITAIWWITIKPSNDRPWSEDVKYPMTSSVKDNIATIDHVRNFNWRTDNDFDARWEKRSYNVDTIKSVDLFLSNWGIKAVSHVLVSFEFENGQHVVFSVEIRKEKGEKYSNIAGFFKEFELTLIAADESDIVKVRTNVRNETVHRYPVKLNSHNRRALFLSYLEEGNKLAANPEFYNTVMANCSTVAFKLVKAIAPDIQYNWRVMASGYLPDYLYDIGNFDTHISLEETIANALINPRAVKVTEDQDFSKEIRKSN